MLIDSQYFPNLQYFQCLFRSEEITIETQEFFEKQTYRNRCKILSANGVDTLIVPVQHVDKKLPIKDLRIDYTQDWVRRHWGAIYSSYGKSPYFEHYAPYFEKILLKKPDFLLDMNMEILTICLKFLKVEKKIYFTEKFEKEQPNDYRSAIHPKKDFSEDKDFLIKPYRQNFGNEFEPNLSILDLLFCQGNRAGDWLVS